MKFIKKHLELLLVMIALLFSAILQLATITKWSIWHDEGYSIMLINFDFKEVIARTALDVHPPLYYLLLKVWASIFGYSELALRSFSVFAALIAITLTYLLLKKLFSKHLAILALPALVLAPFVIRFGQEVRMYTLALVFIMSASLLLVHLAQAKSKNYWLWLVYGALIAASVYTHYFASLIFVAHWYYLASVNASTPKYPVLWPGLKRLLIMPKGWWLAVVSAAVLYLAWLPTVYNQFTLVKDGFWIPPVNYQAPIDAFVRMLYFKPINNYAPSTSIFILTGLVLAITTVILGFKYAKKIERQGLLFLLLMFVIPLILLLAISMLPSVSSLFEIRYFTLYSLAIYGLLGVTMAIVIARSKTMAPKLLVLALLSSLLIGVVIVHKEGNYHYMWQQALTMKQLSQVINTSYTEGDVIISKDLETYFDIDYYNATPQTVKLFAPNDLSKYGNSSLVYDNESIRVKSFGDLRPESGRVWLVKRHDVDIKETPSNWTELESHTDGYATIVLYQTN